MLTITKSDFLKNRQKSIDLLTYGAVFIYPTDTLYGIGCDARSYALVKRIRQIKDNFDQPFSVIAPSKEWIKKNLKYKKEFDKWLDKLSGPYTLIMRIKNEHCISKETTANHDTLGVRIPKNWFAGMIKQADIPIITTSVNVHGSRPITSIKEIPESIKKMVDFAVDDGVIKGKPSTIIDLTRPKPKIIERK